MRLIPKPFRFRLLCSSIAILGAGGIAINDSDQPFVQSAGAHPVQSFPFQPPAGQSSGDAEQSGDQAGSGQVVEEITSDSGFADDPTGSDRAESDRPSDRSQAQSSQAQSSQAQPAQAQSPQAQSGGGSSTNAFNLGSGKKLGSGNNASDFRGNWDSGWRDYGYARDWYYTQDWYEDNGEFAQWYGKAIDR